MKTKILITILILLSIQLSFAQPEIAWQKSLGGSGVDAARSVRQTSDGGYIVVGYINSLNGDITETFGGRDIWVVKLDSSGNIVWEKSVGSTGYEDAYSIQQTIDGGYVLIGQSNSDNFFGDNIGGDDILIVKLDSFGNILWGKKYGTTGTDRGHSIKQTSDGGYIASGFRANGGIWVAKLDANGNLSPNWSNTTFGGAQAWWAEQTSDGGYIVTGHYGLTPDLIVLKLDPSSNVEWQYTYGGTNADYGRSVRQTNDGGYIVASMTQSNDGDVSNNYGNQDFWILKLNSLGGLEWEKNYGGTQNDFASEVQLTSDGGYVIVGQTNSNDIDVSGNHSSFQYDYWVVKINDLGVLQWQKCLGGSISDFGTSIEQTSDGNYIITGRSASNTGDVSGNNGGNSGTHDYWVVKLGRNDCGGVPEGSPCDDGNDCTVNDRYNSDCECVGILDSDNDGVPNCDDICPGSNDLADADADGIPDGCDSCPGSDDTVDTDEDNIPDGCDNCPNDANADQVDFDNDGVGNPCDVCIGDDSIGDSDGDGICDDYDICPGFDDFLDSDGDGIPDGCDDDNPLDIDNDGDGQTENEGDCDDTNANIYAGNTETPYNGIDDDCDALTLDDDLDGDGYNLSEDCDDTNSSINPGATEILDNGIDDDCNPDTPDSALDIDNDGDGQTENEGDCDDTNANIYAGNAETPYNGIDDDCDALTLDDDLDGDGYNLSEDCDDTNSSINPGATEILDNGIDDDCNPDTPDSALDIDNDGDGQTENEGDCDDTNANIYAGNAETPYNGIDDDCDALTLDDDLDGDGYNLSEDCDDTNSSINPGATEILDNGIDDDCNPDTPDSALDIDNDGDGQTENEGDCDDTNANIYAGNAETPYNGIDDDCDALTLDDDLDGDGYNLSEDCDDTNSSINPGATEILDNGIDDDCNPDTPDSALDIDNDGDGQTENEGDCDDTNANIYAGNAETPYNGIDDDCDALTLDDDLDGDGYNLSEDCDDTNSSINPGATEILDNGIDDDCNPDTPDSALDIDNDGDGQTENEGDCDDTNANIYAGNAETPYNGIDDDCDALTLDDDLDGDGYNLSEDCDDTNSSINPGATEILDNGIDDDCNPDTPDSVGECIEYTDNFIVNPLTHSGAGFNTVSFALPNNSQEVSFMIFNIGQKLRGNPNNRYIEYVDVYYVDEFGASVLYDTFSGSSTSEASVSISDVVQSVTVLLYDGEDNSSGNSTMSISFSPVTFCVSNVECDSDTDGDGICDDLDVCEGFDDMIDSDTDGIPDGCDVCPNSETDDSDNDGVCDDIDICIGFDDAIDSDNDGTPDGCDICPNDPTNSCNSNPCAADEVLICHMKNNGTTVEICVKENQLQRHLDHGDTLGTCSDQMDNTILSKENIVLYPNPTNGRFMISFKNHDFIDATLTVHNSFGMLLFQKNISDSEKIPVDIFDNVNQEGVYFVILKKEGQTIAIPIVISK